MITRDSIETAYAFLHQKLRVYAYSTMAWQRDDIEMAIDSFVDSMNADLYGALSQGRPDFLRNHQRFAQDMAEAVDALERHLSL